MRILSLLAITAWCGVLSGLTFADEPAVGGRNPLVEGVGAESKPSESPMPIFNEEIRRFIFQIEHTLVTSEVAQAFMVRYSNPENPDIIGAYADTKTNSLVVIGPPEAEAAIRKSLAVWMVETQAFVNPSLEVQKRQLQEERKTLLSEMAQIEVSLVDTTERKGEQAAKKLQDHLAELENELRITERKIEVVIKYMKRLGEVQE